MTERVRFSPAPTGRLHLGGARTALFNALVAGRGNGTFILRFEDTDATRSDPVFEAGLIEDLAWLGLAWDEGPDIGGPHTPYRQSGRADLYAESLDRLKAAGRAYRCFCDEGMLARERETDVADGRSPRYHGTCRARPPQESAALAESGSPHCWRFAVGPDREVVVHDEVHGLVRFQSADIGDFVVARSDGATLYDFACTVDDAAMGITLVVRGDDHLSNTPRQVLLFEALGAVPPRYAHVPLVMGADGRPLSKSRGAEAVSSLREQGYLPDAVVNHLALLGWSDPAGREVMDRAYLARAFDLSRVSGSAPVHDPARLRWLNGRHMALLTDVDRAATVARHMPELPGMDTRVAAGLLAGEVEVAGDAKRLVAGVGSPLPLDEEAKVAFASPIAAQALEVAAGALAGEGGPDSLRSALREAGLPAREALPVVRAALTGRAHGLPIATLVALIGTAESVLRLRRSERA